MEGEVRCSSGGRKAALAGRTEPPCCTWMNGWRHWTESRVARRLNPGASFCRMLSHWHSGCCGDVCNCAPGKVNNQQATMRKAGGGGGVLVCVWVWGSQHLLQQSPPRRVIPAATLAEASKEKGPKIRMVWVRASYKLAPDPRPSNSPSRPSKHSVGAPRFLDQLINSMIWFGE